MRFSKILRLVFPVLRPNDFSVPRRWFPTLRISPTTNRRADSKARNHTNHQRLLNLRDIFKQTRAAALADWRQLAA